MADWHDENTMSQKVMDYWHHDVFEGNYHYVWDYTILGSGESMTLVIVTPEGPARAHLTIMVMSSAELTASLLKGVSVEANGTEFTIPNRDHASTNTLATKLYHTPTNPTGGTSVGRVKVGAGRSVGGDAQDSQWMILAPSTTYTLTMENEANGDNTITYNVNLVERAPLG